MMAGVSAAGGWWRDCATGVSNHTDGVWKVRQRFAAHPAGRRRAAGRAVTSRDWPSGPTGADAPVALAPGVGNRDTKSERVLRVPHTRTTEAEGN